MRARIIFSLLLFLGSIASAQASHLVGGFLTYQWLSDNGSATQYRVTIYAYRDCTKDGTNNEVPFDAEIGLCIYDGSKKLFQSKTVKLLSKSKVKPVGNTNCPEVTQTCLEQGIYQTNISLPRSNSGYFLKWERCCRNTQTNLKDNGGTAYQGQTYYGIVPPGTIQNSSPYFLDVPVPFICVGDTITIRNRALDPDGDSLSYKLVTPWQGASLSSPDLKTCADPMNSVPDVDYNPGFSATKPFGNAGYASVDAYNGLTTYMAPATGRYAVAVEVTEWRNGIAISTVRLDLQILVINCQPNAKPKLKYENGSRYWEIEEGEPFCTKVTAYDDVDTGQAVTLQAYAEIISGTNGYKGTKATMSPAQNSAKREVTSTFCWTPDCGINTTDTFRVTFEAFDNGCPSKFINENVLIKVKPFKAEETIQGPATTCQNAFARYTIKPIKGHSYVWSLSGNTNVANTGDSILDVVWGNGTTGKLILTITSQYGCEAQVKLDVQLKPAPPQMSLKFDSDTLCVNAIDTIRFTLPPNTDGSFWTSSDLVIGTLQIDYLTLTAKSKGVHFLRYYTKDGPTGCTSKADTLWFVTSDAAAPIISGPTSVCPNNKNIDYSLSPKSWKGSYTWAVSGATGSQVRGDTLLRVDWGGVGNAWVKVWVLDRFGCLDSAKLDVVKNHALKGQVPTGDSSLCAGAINIQHSIKAVSGESYAWTISGGSFNGPVNTLQVSSNWPSAVNGWVGVQAQAWDPVSNLPCLSPVTKLPVIVHPVPAKPLISGLDEHCQIPLGTADFSTSGFLGSTWEWKVSNGLSFTGQGGNKIAVSLSQSGSYLIEAQETSQFGCVGPWGDQSIVIHPKPTANEILGDSFVCYPNLGPVPYRINGLPGSQFNWQLTGGAWVQNPGTNSSGTVQWQLGQVGRLEVQEISQFGCPGDPVVRDVYIDNPSIECQLVSVNPPPGNDASIWVSVALLNAPYNQKGLFIQRRPAGSGSFQTIAELPANTTDYQDVSANPDAFAYDYRAATINACGDTLFSQVQTSVLLTGDKVGALSASISFTPYLGWTTGVDRYELYRSLDGSPNYVLYDQFAIPTQAQYDNGQDGYSHKYRIKAYELGGSRISWSNDLELNFEPLLFIPNAFTPDANGRNDQFVPVSGGLKTYKMRIYSRWGEKLWEGEDPLVGWDGYYREQAMPEGVYVWVVDYSDFRGRTYQTKGTLHLLR